MFAKRLFLTGWLLLQTISLSLLSPAPAASAERRILVTTFPIFQIVRNVTRNGEGIRTELLLSSHLGCPHDYVVTPQDLQKMAKADILVINGLGMESFLEAALKKSNPNVTVIDSSAGIRDLLQYRAIGQTDSRPLSTASNHHQGQEGHSRSKTHHHNHDSTAGVNPHLFASPRLSAQIAKGIASALADLHPELADLYRQNAETYAETLNRLADDMATLGKRLRNNRIVQPHGVFDYLARDIDLDIVATMQPDGHSPSAAEMTRLVQILREKQVGAIVLEPQYPDKIGNTLSRETGVPVVTLDPAASGPEHAPLDHYETVMRRNMDMLNTTLGVR